MAADVADAQAIATVVVADADAVLAEATVAATMVVVTVADDRSL
jgi:hypothetical protein